MGFFLRSIIFKRGRSRKWYFLESVFRLPVIGSFNYINSDNESYTYFLLDLMSMLCISLPFQRQLQSPEFWDADTEKQALQKLTARRKQEIRTIPFFKVSPSTNLTHLCLAILVCTPPTFHKAFLHANVSVAFTDWAKQLHKLTWLYLLKTPS